MGHQKGGEEEGHANRNQDSRKCGNSWVFLTIILHYNKMDSSHFNQKVEHKQESKMKRVGKLISVFYASNQKAMI